MRPLVAIPSEPEAHALASAIPAGTTVLVCGVGVVDAALSVAEALRGGHEAVLLVGLAGTRDVTKVDVGAVVEGTMTVNEAVGAGVGEGFVELGAMGIPGVGRDVDRLPCASIADIYPSKSVQVASAGAIATVGAASGSPAEASAWARRHPDVLAEEMEGWGVARACARAGVPMATLRAISNVAGERDRRRWDFEGAFAALRDALDALLDGGDR